VVWQMLCVKPKFEEGCTPLLELVHVPIVQLAS
jgi:hypothetical protein